MLDGDSPFNGEYFTATKLNFGCDRAQKNPGAVHQTAPGSLCLLKMNVMLCRRDINKE